MAITVKTKATARTFGQIAKSEQEYYHVPTMPIGVLTLITGAGGSGKTTFALKMAACMAAGLPYPDGTANEYGPVKVILCLMESNVSHVVGQLLDFGCTTDTINNVVDLSTVENKSVKFGEAQNEQFSLPRHLERLSDEIQATGAGLVVIDPIVSCLDHEGNRFLQSKVLVPLKKLAETTGCTIWLLNHPTKSGKNIGGFAALQRVPRLSLLLSRSKSHPSMCELTLDKENLGIGDTFKSQYIMRVENNGHKDIVVSSDLEAAIATVESYENGKAGTINVVTYKTVREQIIDLLEEQKIPMQLHGIRSLLPNATFGNVKTSLSRLVDEGVLVQPDRGFYCLPHQAKTQAMP